MSGATVPPGSIRSFVAIAPDASLRERLDEFADELARQPDLPALRWVRAENRHLTLRFLGSIPVERVSALLDALAKALAPHHSFALSLDSVGWFPSPARPRVLAASLRACAPLAELAAAVEGAVVAAGCEPEPRAFRPHITLGRVRGRVRGLEPLCGPSFHSAEMEVRSVKLFESVQGAGGVRYQLLGERPLRADFRAESG
jgi:2'-5' RNA ligase